eukprot:m.80023 g.80023  ORF g.80023 m.80023 type:complete len:51 (-) comp12001_c1_seq3:175-327(-)
MSLADSEGYTAMNIRARCCLGLGASISFEVNPIFVSGVGASNVPDVVGSP